MSCQLRKTIGKEEDALTWREEKMKGKRDEKGRKENSKEEEDSFQGWGLKL